MERFTNYYRAKGSYSRTGVEAKKASKGDKAEDREVGSDSVVKHFASMTPGQDATDTAGMEKKAYPQTESVQTNLAESHFKVGQKVECIASGMEGTVVKTDTPEVGKYYTVKREDGKTMKYAPDELKAVGGMKEEVEKLDELSPGTLQSYKDKAKKEVGALEPHTKKGGEYRDIAKRLQAKRRAGMVRAGARMAGAKPTRESVEELDELSSNTLASYKKKAGADASAADKAGDFKRGNKRFSGIMRATKKEFGKANESVELEEASHVVHITSTDKSGKKEMRTGHVVAQSKSAAINIAKKHYQDQGHTIHAVHYGPKRTPVKEETVEEGMVTDKDSMIAAKLAKLKKAGRINQSEWMILNRMRSKNPDGALSRINTMIKNMQNEEVELEEAKATMCGRCGTVHVRPEEGGTCPALSKAENEARRKKANEDVNEKTLTPAEKKKREEIAQAMERENPGMPMDKKMAIATAQAKKVAEATVDTADIQKKKMMSKSDKDKLGKLHTMMQRQRKTNESTESVKVRSFKSYISEAAINVDALAKDLEAYAKKSGGIDKKDFMDLAAQMKRTKKLPSKKDIMALDTDPRDLVLGMIGGQSGGPDILKRMYGVSM